MEGLTVEKAGRGNLEDILSLNSKLFEYESQYCDSYSMKWTNSRYGREYFINRLSGDSGVVLLARVGEVHVGYICGLKFFHPCRSSQIMAEVENMFVEKLYRRKGIGTALLNEFISYVKDIGVQRIKVGALVGNLAATSFYKKNGFNDHEIILEKEI
ncbi:GNAT family N-acetyltransferase [Candidatus Dojkabacteria bacterium]|nr:GNAT family N-acetyltransferase [Candidatus Dojkabacteria bacterium]